MVTDPHLILPLCLPRYHSFLRLHFTIANLLAPFAPGSPRLGICLSLVGAFLDPSLPSSRNIADQCPQGGAKNEHIDHRTHHLESLETVKNGCELLLVVAHIPLGRECRNSPNERDEQMDDPQGCEKRNRKRMHK